MSLSRYTAITFLMAFFLCVSAARSFGQYGIALDIKKPKEFENRVLQSEKSDKKKFSLPRRLMQNTMTHYNFFFNANNKLNEVLERAKAAHTDDYSELISFYNYSLDATAADTIQLDSIAYKSQTAIVLHDLRSDWADNMYLLWGASYYLKKEFDSAYLMFQFINYAFAEKEKDGYYKTIGSARDGNNAFAVSTKEKSNVVQRIFNEPPSRNEAFIWQIRNYIAQDKFAEAGTLIQILKNDPVFPSRLNNDLAEVQAYSFYKQEMWDSAAFHLENALSNATNKQEKARWEFLLGQLYEVTEKYVASEEYYTKAISHTTDPIMEVYARLSTVRVNKDGGENYIDKNIETLLKMAKRDKYVDYRDIIYYMAAQMELERNNTDNAIALLLKSTKYSANNPLQRNKAFLQLAELSFDKKRYRPSHNFYDSLRLDNTFKDVEAINARKAILAQVVLNMDIIDRQDSLQRIANMPENERRDYVRKLARQLRRQQGLKDEGGITTGRTSLLPQEPTSLFEDNTGSGRNKGEWYFYNSTSRQKGLADFKTKWGSRPNVDNWRRGAALMSIIRNPMNSNVQMGGNIQTQKPTNESTEITFDGLFEKLPVTEEKLKVSNDSTSVAKFNLGVLYIQQLEDCASGTATLEEVRERFPNHPDMAEILYNLYYCYNKNGDIAKAANIKKLMGDKFAASNFTTIVTTGKNHNQKARSRKLQKHTKKYMIFL
ncbi:MAG: tetratricopeptide repeat protein [Chitinophagaceae bacterium]